MPHIDPTAIVNRQPACLPVFGRRPALQPDACLGDNVTVDAMAVIFAGVAIGAESFIGLRATIREGCRIGRRCMIGADVFFNYGVTCGDDVRIIQGAHIGGLASIGSGTFIGPGVQMSNMRRIDPDHQVFVEADAAPIHIGQRVVIGAGAVLVAGISIGDRAVIGSGAVVTRDVPAGATWVGNPARPLAGRCSDIIPAHDLGDEAAQ